MHRPVRRALATALLLVLVAAMAAGGAQASERRDAAELRAQSAAAPGLEGWAPDVRAARRYAERRTGDVRFALVDADERMHRHDAGRGAPAASVFKAMLLATYLRQGSVRGRELNRDDKRLLGPMIRRSDSETATRVRDIVGRRAIERLARRAEMRRFRYHPTWGLSRTNPADQARFFHHYERTVPDRHEGYARRLLSSIVRSQRWGVGRARPDGWRLFFKGGWATGTGRVNHQVAFLERHGVRVSLAIFTEYSPSHGYGKRTLQGVAERLLRDLPKFAEQP
jgi:hypothetical protein